MTDPLEISPVSRPIRGHIRPPGSKSITNRALVCAALADGISTITGALDSEDTRVMVVGLGQLGIQIESSNGGQTLIVRGAAGEVPALEAEIFCANSGTTMRFLTALVTLGHGSFRLDGIPRMRERPIAGLLDALNQLGALVTSENKGCPPVVIHANGLPGGMAKIRGDISSQFLSGVLMVAPTAHSAVELVINGPLVSQPYIRMTIEVMKAFGVKVSAGQTWERFHIPAPQSYTAREYDVEPDASAASYFWAAAAVTGGQVTIEGLSAASLQGDVAFVDCLEKMGCEVIRSSDSITVIGRTLRGIDIDMTAISDTVQTLAVVAAFAKGPTMIRNVGHIRHKETDRLAGLAAELRKLGVEVVEHADGLAIEPRALTAATIETYNDHRMAMSFALAGLRIPGVRIENPHCVKKTYPRFFDDLSAIVSES